MTVAFGFGRCPAGVLKRQGRRKRSQVGSVVRGRAARAVGWALEWRVSGIGRQGGWYDMIAGDVHLILQAL